MIVEHISIALTTMLNSCPHCGATPLKPCTNGSRELRYTHTERNR
jgi:hypothetical protein